MKIYKFVRNDSTMNITVKASTEETAWVRLSEWLEIDVNVCKVRYKLVSNK